VNCRLRLGYGVITVSNVELKVTIEADAIKPVLRLHVLGQLWKFGSPYARVESRIIPLISVAHVKAVAPCDLKMCTVCTHGDGAPGNWSFRPGGRFISANIVAKGRECPGIEEIGGGRLCSACSGAISTAVGGWTGRYKLSPSACTTQSNCHFAPVDIIAPVEATDRL
jgi:hypothetical protein